MRKRLLRRAFAALGAAAFAAFLAPPVRAATLISLRADTLRPGLFTEWKNGGTLSGLFRPGRPAPRIEIVAGRPAVTFSGNGDFLRSSFPVPPALAGRRPFTAAAWVLDPALGAKKTIASWAGGTKASAEFGIGFGRNAAFFSSHLKKTGYQGGVPAARRWQHVAIVHDGNAVAVFLNGRFNAERAMALDVRPGPAVFVGASWIAGRSEAFQPFSGSLAALEIHDRALSDAEVWRLADNLGPPARRPKNVPAGLPLPSARELEKLKANAEAFRSSDPSEVVFLVASDPHYGGTVTAAAANARTVDEMNRLPGIRLPKSAGPGVVSTPRGVVVLGDIVEDGSAEDAPEVWSMVAADYGVRGGSRLLFPVYEGTGNHDGDAGGPVRAEIKSRNRLRPGLASVSPDGLHYSWDWGPLHAVHLNLFPGTAGDDYLDKGGDKSGQGWRSPRHSLEFLVHDLARNVGKSGRPVILFQHYGWDEWARSWWSGREREAYAAALKGYRVAAIFWGHSHVVQRVAWKGIPTWCAGSANRDPEPGVFLVVRWTPGSLMVAERVGNLWGRVDRVALGAAGAAKSGLIRSAKMLADKDSQQ